MNLPDGLTQSGLKFRDAQKNENPLDFKEIEKIKLFIQRWIVPRKTINKNKSSYGLKHTVERMMNQYVSNGNFIAAMILEGYEYKQIPGSFNCYFNASYKILGDK